MNEISKNNFIVIFTILLAVGCGSDMSLDIDEYKEWLTDNKYIYSKTKRINPLVFMLTYRPVHEMVLAQSKGKILSKDEFLEAEYELEGLQYYTLKIGLEGDAKTNITNYKVSNKSESDQRLYYLSFLMKNDIYLIEGNDTLNCQLYHFERAFNLSNHRTFNLAFDKSENGKNKDKTIIIDSPFFGTGPVKMKFQAKELNNIPTIKYPEQ